MWFYINATTLQEFSFTTRVQCGQIVNQRNDQEFPQNDQFSDQAKIQTFKNDQAADQAFFAQISHIFGYFCQ